MTRLRFFFITIAIILVVFSAISVFSAEDVVVSTFTKLKHTKLPVAVSYNFKITRVIDGDTVAFQADFLPEPLKQELSLRVYGVDTPEKGHRAECPSEAEKGQQASAFTKALVKNATTTKILIMKWDKYGGRVIGDVILDGKSLTKQLLTNGYAREYYGKKKESWCK